MRKDLLQIVCCPEDKANLFLEGAKLDEHGDVVAGTLRCIECGFGYPIEDGIPNLLPPQYHVKSSKAKQGKGAAGKAGSAKPKGPAKSQTQAAAGGAQQDDASGDGTGEADVGADGSAGEADAGAADAQPEAAQVGDE